MICDQVAVVGGLDDILEIRHARPYGHLHMVTGEQRVLRFTLSPVGGTLIDFRQGEDDQPRFLHELAIRTQTRWRNALSVGDNDEWPRP